MPQRRPEIFISATSSDLRSARQIVRDGLLSLGCLPMVQEHFPPDARTVRAMLRARLAECDAVVHLAGECFGSEPAPESADVSRRSYTQLEYDLARELRKPLYVFLCAERFPYDAHPAEPAAARELQQTHRAALASGDQLFYIIADPPDLALRVRELRVRVETLKGELQRTRDWLGRGLVAGLVVIAALGTAHWYEQGKLGEQQRQLTDQRRRTAEQDEQIAEQRKRSAEQDARIAALTTRLQEITPATDAVIARLDSASGPSGPAGEQGTALADAQRAAGQATGKSTEEVKAQIVREHDDVAALHAEIKTLRTDATKAPALALLEREALTKLGDTAEAAGGYIEAIRHYKQALAHVDEDSAPLAWCETAQKLETAFWQQGLYAEAEPLARKIVEKRTRLLGATDRATLKCLNNLGALLQAKSAFREAEPIYRQVLAAREQTLGAEHPDTLDSVNNLAAVLADLGDRAAAEPLYRRALAVRQRTFGADNPKTLNSLNNLAAWLAEGGDLAGAEPLYREALAGQERTLGAEHPTTLATVNNLAEVLRDKGAYDEAEPLFHRALDGFRRKLGPEHRYTFNTMNGLGLLLFKTANYAAAEPLLRHALDGRKVSLGAEHTEVAAAAHDYALLCEKLGRHEEAIALAAEAAAIARKNLPESSPDRRKFEAHLAALKTPSLP